MVSRVQGSILVRYVTQVMIALTMMATLTAATSDPLPESTFVDAMDLLQQKKYAQAIKVLEYRAALADQRAELMLGLIYTEGKWVPKDLARGYSWLQIANRDTERAPGKHAQAALDELGMRLSGADLIKADELTNAIREQRRQSSVAELATARARLAGTAVDMTARDPVPRSAGPIDGCALDAAIRGCPKDLKGTCALADDDPRTGPMPNASDPEALLTEPSYPRLARREGAEGTTLLMAHVDRTGYICRVVVARASHVPAIDESALDAVRLWRLKPAMDQGNPVESYYILGVTLQLEGYQLETKTRD